MGTAGSGKTLIAIQTARWLAQHGHRTLITCINKRLGRSIAATTAGEENIRAVHFHSLAYDLAREANEIEERDEQPLPDDPTYFSEELPAALMRTRRCSMPVP
ncbi:MAG: hypothetical protein ACRDH7_13235 [Actinomycetota bacterium]